MNWKLLIIGLLALVILIMGCVKQSSELVTLKGTAECSKDTVGNCQGDVVRKICDTRACYWIENPEAASGVSPGANVSVRGIIRIESVKCDPEAARICSTDVPSTNYYITLKEIEIVR